MPKHIERKISDFDNQINLLVAKYIRRYVDDYQDKENTTRDFVAKKVGISQGRLSQLLGNGATNDEEMYRKILSVCGYGPRVFIEILEKAKKEVIGDNDIDFNHALSSKYGATPQAMEELKNFSKYIDQKYGIKE